MAQPSKGIALTHPTRHFIFIAIFAVHGSNARQHAFCIASDNLLSFINLILQGIDLMQKF
jgi:hypothetical protein